MTAPSDIAKRMILARRDYLIANRGPLEGMICSLPTKEYERWTDWVRWVDNDPWLGHQTSGLQSHAFGMDIIHAPSTSVIEVNYQ